MANFLTAVLKLLTNVLKRDTQQKTHATQQINTQCCGTQTQDVLHKVFTIEWKNIS